MPSPERSNPGQTKVAIAQIAPVWLDRERTLEKAVHWVDDAAAQG